MRERILDIKDGNRSMVVAMVETWKRSKNKRSMRIKEVENGRMLKRRVMQGGSVIRKEEKGVE